jgi:hypothetical protein
MKPFVFKYQGLVNGVITTMLKDFDTQKEMIRYVVANKEAIITQKKAVVKNADAVQFEPITMNSDLTAIKGLKPVYENDKEAGILKRTILANTYWWMDSHDDVHIGRGEGDKGIFTESIQGKSSRIPPIDQHNYSLDGKMGKTITLSEEMISWRELGLGKTGMTEGLFAVAEIHKNMNERRYNDYLNNEIDQHSVGMQYQDIELAVNDQEEFPKEFKVWQKYINKIGNRSRAEGKGLFFAVSKAKLVEYSAVIAGSNELTPVIGAPSGEGAKSSAGAQRDPRVLEGLKELLNKTKI